MLIISPHNYLSMFFAFSWNLLYKLCIAQQNLSIGVNVVSKGSPSRIFKVLRISLGITILPKSSTLLTIPVAVPDICLRRRCSLASVDRGHSLRSLLPPQAALPSLPSCFHISFSFSVGTPLLRCPRTPEDGCPYNFYRTFRRGGCPHPPVKISPCWAGRCAQSSPTFIIVGLCL